MSVEEVTLTTVTWYLGGCVKFPTTPPARRKHQTGLPPPAPPAEVPPLTKSKSHDSQLGVRLDGEPDPNQR